MQCTEDKFYWGHKNYDQLLVVQQDTINIQLIISIVAFSEIKMEKVIVNQS